MSAAEAALQAHHHATLGTKLKNLATGKSQAERHQQKAAKDKLVRRVLLPPPRP